VTIPAGAFSTQIRVEPFRDNVPEGIETLVATISNCPPPGLLPPCYDFDIDPAHESATVFIRDDGLTGASLTITNPKEGANFNIGETILIEATAIDLNGYISRVEFFDGDQLIGESEIVFIRAPDLGTPIYHSFEWLDAAPGAHVLTARAADALGTAISSRPVRITVGPISNQPPRIAIIRPANGTEFPLDTPIEIVADTRDPDGYVPKVEFFADDRKIGESTVEFIRPPDPGQPQTFTFVWRQPAPGPHALTARATDDDGDTAMSAPVGIKVASSEPLPIVTVTARDPFAVEPSSNTVLNTATFCPSMRTAVAVTFQSGNPIAVRMDSTAAISRAESSLPTLTLIVSKSACAAAAAAAAATARSSAPIVALTAIERAASTEISSDTGRPSRLPARSQSARSTAASACGRSRSARHASSSSSSARSPATAA
jgi:hypothetical protein